MRTLRVRPAVRAALIGAIVAPLATMLAPAANAALLPGNYSAFVDGRNDFHTWTWALLGCVPSEGPSQCAYVSAHAMPIAKAYQWYSRAYQSNGTYTLTVDVPDGLRCGNIYYGPTIPTHDVYTFDANTLVGKLDSTFDVGCDNAPGGTFTYPFRLVRL